MTAQGSGWWCKILLHIIAAEILAVTGPLPVSDLGLRAEHMLPSYWSPAGNEAFLLVAAWSDLEPCRWGLDTGKLIILIGVVSSKLAWARESGQARPALETAKSKTGSRSEGGRAALTNWLGSQPCWKINKNVQHFTSSSMCAGNVCMKQKAMCCVIVVTLTMKQWNWCC